MKQSLARRNLRLFPALLAVGFLTAATPAFAQPGMNGGPGMDGAPGMNGGPGSGRGGGRGGNRPDRAAMQAQMLQRQLERAGYTDLALVEAVTTYVANREAARQPLRAAAGALSQALADPNSTDAQITQLTDDFEKAIEAEKARTVGAEAELDGQINFSKTPKLKAVLMLSGVIGEGESYLGQQAGGRGGRGGGQGPNGGRRGGQNNN